MRAGGKPARSAASLRVLAPYQIPAPPVAVVPPLLAGNVLAPAQRDQAGQAAISFQVMENGEPDFGRPSWMPSDHVLPAIVPIGQFLIRARQMIVALSHLSVYPNGCMLDVRASAHGHDVAFDIFECMVFTAQFGAEITAVMHDKTAPRWRPDGKPALLLMQYGQEGDRAVLSPEAAGWIARSGSGSTRFPRPSRAPCPSSPPTLAPARPAARWMGGPSSRQPQRRSPTGADSRLQRNLDRRG